MNRRGFLASVIAAAAAPAVVRAASLMPVTRIWVPDPAPILFPEIGSGVSDLFYVGLTDAEGNMTLARLPLMFAEKNGRLENINQVIWNPDKATRVSRFSIHNAFGDALVEGPLRRSVSVGPEDHLLFNPSALKITLE